MQDSKIKLTNVPSSKQEIECELHSKGEETSITERAEFVRSPRIIRETDCGCRD